MQHVSAKVQNAIIRPTPPYFVHLYHNAMSLLYIIIIIIIPAFSDGPNLSPGSNSFSNFDTWRHNKSNIRNDLFDNTYHHRQYSNKKHVYSQVHLPCTVAMNHFTLTSWCSELCQWVAQLLPTLRRYIMRPPLGFQTEKSVKTAT